jgi:hypothetical protein
MALSGTQLAYKYALSGVLRSGSGRSNYTDPRVYVSIAGTQRATGRSTSSAKVVQGSLTINESNGVDANTCTFQAIGFEPTVGQEVIVCLGSRNNGDRLFAGNIQSVRAGYIGSTAFGTWNVSAIDYSWQLTRKRVVKRYTSQSATAIAQDLVSQVTGFTSTGVASGLDTIDEISFTFDTVLSALTQLANRIGGYVKVDYLKNVHLGVSDTYGTPPVSLTSANQTADAVAFTTDLTHVITRMYEEGGGSNALGAVSAGDTMLPVEDPVWYAEAGGTVVCGPQEITYTATVDGGGGTLVGPGTGPAAAPVATSAAGTGVESGTHLYAYTFITGSGESLPGPTASFLVGPMPDPTMAPVLALDATVSMSVGYYNYAYTFVVGAGETLASPITSIHHNGAGSNTDVTLPLGPGGTTARKVYRSDASGTLNTGATLKLIATIADNTTTLYIDVTGGGTSAGAAAPGSNTTVLNQVALSSIGLGPSGTTSRKVYRTVAAGSQLKLLTTIADNTTTTYTDSTADASLGANAPTSDNSGLSQPTGQILAGATTLLVAGAGGFSSSGGWAVIGNGQQVIRYTGISANTLTGVPASGTGAITSTVAYNSSITAAPVLTGIPASGAGAIVYDIAKGDPVNILVQADDITAQVAIAALVGGDDDGVIAAYQRDGRISETEARTRAEAALVQHASVDVSVTANSRDLNMRAGRTWTVSVTAPTTVSQTFILQSVTTSNFQTAIAPTRSIVAGSVKATLADIVRFIQALTR